jgi:hypothetical protein
MNDMTVAGQGGAVATQDEYDPYAEYGREIGTPIVGKLMKFAKGDYLVGDDELEAGFQVVANMASILRGWIKWQDQKPVEQIMGLLKEGHKPQKRDTLGDLDDTEWAVDKDNKPQDPWQETNYIVFKGVTDSELYTFSTASVGGRGAFKKLCEAYATGRRMHPNQFPIIALKTDSYKHKDTTLGRIKIPEFRIVGWAPASVFDDADAEGGEAVQTDSAIDRVGRGSAAASPSGAPRF